MAAWPEEEEEEEGEGEKEEGEGEKEEEFVISRSTWTPAKRSDSPVQEFLPQLPDKPLASSRFLHRRLAKSSPEGTMNSRLNRILHSEEFELQSVPDKS